MPYMRKNSDTPFGFMPYNGVKSVGAYRKLSSYSTAVYPGDAVILTSDGVVQLALTNSTNIIGVSAVYSAASTADNNVLVYDDPHQLFMVQDDSAGTAMDSSSVGLNTRIVATAGSSTTFRSLQEIDSGQCATTATDTCVRVVQMHPIEANSFPTATSQQRKWIVQFNKHARQQGIANPGT